MWLMSWYEPVAQLDAMFLPKTKTYDRTTDTIFVHVVFYTHMRTHKKGESNGFFLYINSLD